MKHAPGFSLIEIIIALSISAAMALVVYQFSNNGLTAFRLSTSRSGSQESARRAMDAMTEVVREARAADNGAFAIAQGDANRIMLYANVDQDTAIERAEFALNGTSLEKRIVEPTGSPAQYTQAPIITSVVKNVRTLSFDYFDDNYTGTQAALVQPVTLSVVRLVRLTVSVDDNVNLKPSAVTISTMVALRNLKDNL